MKTRGPDGSLYNRGSLLDIFEVRLRIARVVAEQVINDSKDFADTPQTALAWAVDGLVDDFEEMTEAFRQLGE